MDTTKIVIASKNIILTSTELNHAEDMFRELTSEIVTHMYIPVPKKIEEIISFIKRSSKQNEAGTNFQITILKKGTNEHLGNCGIHHIDTKTPEFGIWLKKSAHGNGYGREAITILKKWADENLDYDYIKYPVVDINYPSRRIPESLKGKLMKEYDKINLREIKQHIVEYWIYPLTS